ncbi:hypothetical protein ElyMa_005254900 [Elysia marginata]|uniref:Uncharacterized protein n=1 Tax=Elysia marginata TaxID=1093978 RepID=A0AAV4JZ12_9GAST|nr:hypothetical protein ElyMa_005254900 [Elysia marginata]
MVKPELTNRTETLPARGSRATIIADRLLPRIGYTPEKKTREHASPTPHESRQGVETPLHLPPIAASTPGSVYSPRSSVMSTSMEFGVRPDINRERNFKGRYYDPGTLLRHYNPSLKIDSYTYNMTTCEKVISLKEKE